jgi:hypothetical protein
MLPSMHASNIGQNQEQDLGHLVDLIKRHRKSGFDSEVFEAYVFV